MQQQSRLRRRIASEAARLYYLRHETDLKRAKLRAGRSLCGVAPRPNDLPTDREVRQQIDLLTQSHEETLHRQAFYDARSQALQIMRRVAVHRPLLVESSLRAHVQRGTPLQLHLFATDRAEVISTLALAGISAAVVQRNIDGQHALRSIHRVVLQTAIACEITVYPASLAGRALRNRRTGRRIRRVTSAHLEAQLECPTNDFDPAELREPSPMSAAPADRFTLYQALLTPLEQVRQSPTRHPEGDCLYHSLQVFERARDELPYDEEFLLAALLHDVGKGIDPGDPIAAGLEALGESVTSRTRWLIEHHAEGQAMRGGTLGARARRRLEANENFEELMLLADCDRAGRQVGVSVEDTTAALEYIRQLSEMCGD